MYNVYIYIYLNTYTYIYTYTNHTFFKMLTSLGAPVMSKATRRGPIRDLQDPIHPADVRWFAASAAGGGLGVPKKKNNNSFSKEK